MATNKKITQLDELTPATWADDDVIAIVDISAQETKKIQLSTFRGAVTGVSTLNASTPLTVDSATGDVTISVAIDGGGTINAVFDEDNMASNSPTALATQQSIKAYVDSQVGTVDTLAEILANGNTSGGTNIVVSSGDVITTNTINETTAASGVTIDSLLVKDGGITAAGTSTFAGQTITNLGAVTTADINGGTIDGTVIGGSSPAAISGTTGTFSGNLTVDTNTLFVNAATNNVGIGTSSPASALTVSDGTASGLTPFGGTELFLDSSGDNYLQFGSGTSSSPAIYFGDSADGDVGGIIYAHASNAMSFRTNGAERLRISSAGLVGIGTAAPGGNLHVQGAAGDQVRLYLTDGDATGTGNSLLIGKSGTASFISDRQASSKLWFGTADTERMRIDSSGNVGIGTSSPTNPLHVVGEGTFTRGLELGINGVDATSYITQYRSTVETLIGPLTTRMLFGTVSNHDIAIQTNNTERMRITSTGNVGIGGSSPTAMLDVAGDAAFGAVASAAINGAMVNIRQPIAYDPADGDGTSAINIITQTTIADGSKMGGISWARMTSNGGTAGASISAIGETTNNTGLAFSTGASNIERMRISSAGNVGIGTSSPSTLLHLASTGSAILTLEADTDNVTESDNARIELSQDGGDTTGHLGYGNNTNGIDVWNDWNDYVRIGTNNIERLRVVNNGVVRPATDNVQTLGAAANRWSVVYAGTGTINTSDEREKQQIADLDDAERRVAVAIKGLVKKYKYNDAVALKGDDARIHVGVIAQEVIAAFAAEGLDATRYALLCHDTWEAEPEEVDKNGNVINPGIEAGERYGIRYDELLAFMIAAL